MISYHFISYHIISSLDHILSFGSESFCIINRYVYVYIHIYATSYHVISYHTIKPYYIKKKHHCVVRMYMCIYINIYIYICAPHHTTSYHIIIIIIIENIVISRLIGFNCGRFFHISKIQENATRPNLFEKLEFIIFQECFTQSSV